MTENSVPLLAVSNLAVDYGHGRSRKRVLHDINLTIAEGETVGVLGESGSGKTTLGRAIVGLVPVAEGTITFRGQDITHLRGKARRRIAKHIQVVFQDPFSSLNPAVQVGRLMAEPLTAAGMSEKEATAKVHDLLHHVGLPDDAPHRFPGDFSGGQRQRIAIARALVGGPALIVCDEPVSALDVSVQAQVLNLLRDLQDEFRFGYLFIGHNIDVVRFMSHTLAVLEHGQMVEVGPSEVVASQPQQPYTQALLEAVLSPDPDIRDERRAARMENRERLATAV